MNIDYRYDKQLEENTDLDYMGLNIKTKVLNG